MRFKNKWLNRVTAAVLSIGMALTPAVMNSGVTFADVKNIESPIPVTRSETKPYAPSTQTETVTLGNNKYEITAKMSQTSVELQVGEEIELEVTLTSNIVDATSSNAIAAVANQFTWVSNASNVDVIGDGTNKAKVVCPEIPGSAFITVGVDIAEAVFVVGTEIIMDESLPEEWPSVILPISSTLAVRQTVQLTPEFLNCDDLKTEVKGYSSDRPDIATVDENGLVRAVSVGTAIITGTFTIDGKLYQETSEIIVTEENTDTPVTPEAPEITLSKTELLLFRGWNQGKEKVEVTPADRDYEWESSNSEIAFGGSDGYVYAGRKAGTATITVTDKETKKSASIQVKVVTISPDVYTLILEEGQEVNADVGVNPAGVNIFEYAAFTTDDPDVAVIKGDSTIQALKEGETRIRLKRNKKDTLLVVNVYVLAKGQQSTPDSNDAYVDIDDSDEIIINDPEGYLDSLDDYDISNLKERSIQKISKDFSENSEVFNETENITKVVQLPADKTKKAVLWVDSVLTGMEAKAVSEWELYPTKLIFSSEIDAIYYDAETGRKIDGWEKIDNKYLTGESVDFRLPIPSEITEKYAQIVHKSEGYEDENIPNLEIKRCKVRDYEGNEHDASYIDVSLTHFSDLIVTFTNEKVKEDSGNDNGNNGGSTGGNNGGNANNNGSSNNGSGSSSNGSGSSNSGSGSSSSGSSSSTSSSSSSGGSSRSYTYRGTKKAAQWAQDSRGWRFQNADETYVTNRWIELSWNEKSAWYRFNEQGYMVTGWFKDGDGNWYFMNDRADGTQGAMVTGWHQIAGKWYYFRVTAGGPVGSLVMNATTPDGYKVDGNGVWIQ